MYHFRRLIVFFLVFMYHEYEAFQLAYTSILFPVTKHTDTGTTLYSIKIMASNMNTKFTHISFLIDIDAPFTWHDCVLVWSMMAKNSCPSNKLCNGPVSCEEYQCTEVRTSYSYESPSCPKVTNSSTLPGWGFCTCPVNVRNPINGLCSQPELNYDGFIANTSDGRNPFRVFQDFFLNAACAPTSSFTSFPENVTGVMAFSTSLYALPASLYLSLLKRSFAICLPSNLSGPGILFYGAGPFYLLPHTNVDVRSLLSYTQLVKHPHSFGYFIGVKAIVIRGRYIQLPHNTTTKFSTTEPYTTLTTGVYNNMVQRFSKVTKRIPRARPVAPFSLCFRTVTNGSQVDLRVPDIDLSLQDGKKWTISSANSMKHITKRLACLAFVDAGARSEYGIVIGTFQLEDNFVLIDLENSSVGFSSSLLNKQTSCSNFNFSNGKMDTYQL